MADFYVTLQSAIFQTQTRFYANQSAIAVKNEDPTTSHHDERVAFASRILAGIAPFYEMSLSIGSNATIRQKIEEDQSYDGDMAFVMATIFDAYALN